MTKGIPRKQQLAEQRRKRAQTAPGLAQGAKKPPKAIPVPSAAKRASAGREPLPTAHYPVKRVAIGKRQVPRGAG
jgi:hypothetical protein